MHMTVPKRRPTNARLRPADLHRAMKGPDAAAAPDIAHSLLVSLVAHSFRVQADQLRLLDNSPPVLGRLRIQSLRCCRRFRGSLLPRALYHYRDNAFANSRW